MIYISFVRLRVMFGATDVLLYISMLLITQAADIELNPGPRKLKFPCQACNKAVKWDPQKPGIACDGCSLWFHKDCLYMHSQVFEALAKSDASWICCNCGLPNYSTHIFESFAIDSTNSFSMLSDADNSIASINNSDAGQPKHTSSPVPVGNPKRQDNIPIRTLVVNFQSIVAKKASFWELISSFDPDIIIGSETWLSASVLNSEFLPENYKAYRKDRADGYGPWWP